MLLALARIYDWVFRLLRIARILIWKRYILVHLWWLEHVPFRIWMRPRSVPLFTALNIAMGIALILGDGSVTVLRPRALAHHWDLIYGVEFLVAGAIHSLGLLRWPNMTVKTYARIRRWSSGVTLTVTLGWTLLEVSSSIRYTQDWTASLPWMAIVMVIIITMERFRIDMASLPSQLDELRRELSDEHD